MIRIRPLAARVAATRPPAAATAPQTPKTEEPFIPDFERTQQAPVVPPASSAAVRYLAAEHVEPCLPGFEPLLTPAQCAKQLGVSVSTLQAWRALGKGPTFVKFSRRTVRYQPAAVAAWIAAQQRG